MFVNAIDPFSKCIPVDSSENFFCNHLNDLACEKMQAICADNKRRLEGCKNDPQLLEKGIFYSCEYFNALKETGQSERLESLKNKDIYLSGYVEYFKNSNKDRSFTLKEGVIASEALKGIFKGLSFIECGGACDIAQYMAILDILGEDKFNFLFASDSPTPLIIGSRLPLNPLYRLRTRLKRGVSLQRGDLVYFENHRTYLEKHVAGIAQGYNTFCIDNTSSSEKFTGLGLPENGWTRKKIIKELVREFNSSPDNLQHLSEKTKAEFFKVHEAQFKWSEYKRDEQIDQQDLTTFPHQYGTPISRLDAKKITSLADSSLEQARKLLEQWTL